MLRNLDDNKVVNASVPSDFRILFSRIKKRMDLADFAAAESAIDAMINNHGPGNILAASWMPGRDWTNTAFEPIYAATCKEIQGLDPQHGFSARFFGQLVRQRFVAHPDNWLRFYSDGLANSWVYLRDPA